MTDAANELLKEASGRPTIVVNNRRLRDISSDALEAILSLNADTPTVFSRGGVLVRVGFTGLDFHATPFNHAALKGTLDRLADFVKVKADGEEMPARPPDDVVADLLNLPDQLLPELRGGYLMPCCSAGWKNPYGKRLR